ncbi:hypothetical protein PM082_011682 [Marasmius tenuissimus]|nr:hypothetical protein PM082_011682 [Marasmius tenuissimus]
MGYSLATNYAWWHKLTKVAPSIVSFSDMIPIVWLIGCNMHKSYALSKGPRPAAKAIRCHCPPIFLRAFPRTTPATAHDEFALLVSSSSYDRAKSGGLKFLNYEVDVDSSWSLSPDSEDVSETGVGFEVSRYLIGNALSTGEVRREICRSSMAWLNENVTSSFIYVLDAVYVNVHCQSTLLRKYRLFDVPNLFLPRIDGLRWACNLHAIV